MISHPSMTSRGKRIAGVIALIILFFLTQRWFVRGITMSGLGGR